MKLLILTQKVNKNDAILGFFHRWIIEFAKHCEAVIVICLEKGEYDLPDNVRIFSLGKESGASKLERTRKFYSYIWKYRNEYDAVFVHMNPEYVILGGIFWRMIKKKVCLWYTHKSVDLKLKIAEKITNIIFSASKRSFRLESGKLSVMGHGIDTEQFRPFESKVAFNGQKIILQVGRVSPAKHQLEAVEILQKLRNQGIEAHLWIVGEPITESEILYAEDVKEDIKFRELEEAVFWKGTMPNTELPEIYNSVDLILNLSTTGSMDKDVLEAMACDRPVVTTNEAYEKIPPFVRSVNEVEKRIEENLLGKNIYSGRKDIVQHHSLSQLINNILKKIKS